MVDPLHQFLIQPLVQLQVGSWDISFTNSSLFMVLTTGIILLFLFISTRKSSIIPGRLQHIGEASYQFITDMVQENVGDEGVAYVPYVFSLFLFILLGNSLGMIPYGFTFTSHIIVTVTLALLVFISVTVLGFIRHGFHFFRLFCPEGTPFYIAPLLVPVEIMSYFTRPVSLSVRLFANMMAGHVMLKLFSGFVVILLGTELFPAAILPFAVNVAVIGFEFLVATLQAYVFTVLTCIYLNDAINLH